MYGIIPLLQAFEMPLNGESPVTFATRLPLKKAATYSPTFAVPSALRGLTSLFGMGRGGTPSL